MRIICKVNDWNASETLVGSDLMPPPDLMEMLLHLVRRDVMERADVQKNAVTVCIDVNVAVRVDRKADGLLGESVWHKPDAARLSKSEEGGTRNP